MSVFPTLVTLVNAEIIAAVATVGTVTPSSNIAGPSDCLDTIGFNMYFDTGSSTWKFLAGTQANGVLVDVSRIQGNVKTVSQGDSTGQVILVASASRSASGSAVISTLSNFKTGIIQLDVTSIGGSGTMDVYIDTQTDGTTWINMAHFTQFSTVTGRRALQLSETATPSTTDFDATSTLSSGTVRLGPWGSTIRVNWIIAGGGSYTFDVTASFKA
jgi:hypothetical protein